MEIDEGVAVVALVIVPGSTIGGNDGSGDGVGVGKTVETDGAVEDVSSFGSAGVPLLSKPVVATGLVVSLLLEEEDEAEVDTAATTAAAVAEADDEEDGRLPLRLFIHSLSETATATGIGNASASTSTPSTDSRGILFMLLL